MAKDYKHAANKDSSGSQTAPGWIWLIAGFAAGFATAVIMKIHPQQVSEQLVGKPAQEQAATSDQDESPRFDFYKMLPNFEVIIPEQDKETQKSGEIADVTQPGTYVLQVGAFKNFPDADRMKASLALLGLESRIQRVTIDDKTTWHRVRIGPFSDLQRLNGVRDQLADNNIEAILIRVNE